MTSPSPASVVRPWESVPVTAYRGVWVFIELERGVVHHVSWELLGEGRKLADALGVELAAVIAGPPDGSVPATAAEAMAYGADLAHVVEDPVLGSYRTLPYTKVLTDLVNEVKPEILLLGATTLGRDLAGSVATTLATGLTADCTGLAIDPTSKGLASTRPTFGGTLLCTIHTARARPQMATVRPRVMSMPSYQTGRSGPLVPHMLGLAEAEVVTKVLNYIPDAEVDKPRLAEAEIVVAGGRGLGKPENLQLVRDLAAALGAEYGGSRPLVQRGWIPADRQIGQTGKTIRPRLYIAAGISGAVQHRVGVEGADQIVAINIDPNAPIFEFADCAVVADALQVLPALTRAALARRTAGVLVG